ncbi:MAG TPA: C45 family peptidase [Polyangiaceae bacterium]|nr:C45 family peptidase [Polyangiaceae bacterium]
MSELYELRTIHCAGAPRELGRAQGEEVRDLVRGFVAQRLDALQTYLDERGSADVSAFLDLGQRCLMAQKRWDPEGYAEHCGIAEGARVGASELYAVSNMTDLRDVLLLSKQPDREGCSSLMLPAHLARDGHLLAGQTWDLNPTDLDYVVAVHRLPEDGPETWAVTCVGSLTLMGMNEHGVAVGTTNIKTYRCRTGVGYLSVLHRAIRATSSAEARAQVEQAPRAAAHTYWVADDTSGVELECSSELCVRRDLAGAPLARTNHCLSAALKELEGEPATSSSEKRLLRLLDVLSRGEHDVASLRALYSDRSDGVDSICRYAEDEQGTTTNACMICEPATRRLWLCRGPADRGAWQELAFERRPAPTA